MTALPFSLGPGQAGALLGRESEFAMLEELLEQIPERGGSLCLEGSAGLGKTSLIDWAGQAAEARGFAVWRAEGTLSEQDIPLAALGQLLTPVREMIARLPPEMRAGLDVALGFETAAPARIDKVRDAFGELLRRVDGPVLLMVDDLQWLDAESAQVLTSSLVAARIPGVGLLAARRPQPSAVRPLMPVGLWRVRRLRPLGGVLSRALVRRVSPAVSAPVLASLVTAAAGNPLALVELPAALSEAELSGSALSADAVPLSPRLERLHSEQILQLPAAARQVLLLAALDDGHTDLTADLGEEERAGLIVAEEHGLIRTDARKGAIRFRHPLIGPTVLRLSTSSARRAAHVVLAQRHKTHEDRYAWHLAAGAIGPDEDVAALLESAADRALRRGRPDLAIQSYLLAAQLSTALDGRARRLTYAASVGAGSLGTMQQASRLLAQARQVHPAVLATVPAATVAAQVLMSTTGELANAQRVLTPAIASALHQMTGRAPDPMTGPMTDRAGIRAETSVAPLRSVNRDELGEALHHLLNLCLYACDERTWATFHTVVAGVDLSEFPDLQLRIDALADPVRTALRALPRLDAALAGLDEHTDANRIGRLAMAAFYLDRVDEVRALLLQQANDAQSGGPVGPGILALSLLSIQCIKTGHWAEADRLARAGLVLCEQSGHLLYTAPFEFSIAMLAAGRGDSDTVARTCSHLLGWALPRGIRIAQVYAAHAQTMLFLGAGDFDRAYREITSVCPPGTFAPHLAWAIWMSLDLVEAAVLSHHPKEAAAHVDAMHGHDLGALSSRCALSMAGATAIAATAFDRDLFEAALAVPDAGRWPFDLARIELRYGQGLRRARFASEARRHLEEALATFERLGADGWAEQARTELLATSPAKTAPASERTGTLTPQERVVAHLAATGLANKAIANRLQISPRTVGAHLRNIFGKLDVRTRAALTDALADVPSGAPAEVLGVTLPDEPAAASAAVADVLRHPTRQRTQPRRDAPALPGATRAVDGVRAP